MMGVQPNRCELLYRLHEAWTDLRDLHSLERRAIRVRYRAGADRAGADRALCAIAEALDHLASLRRALIAAGCAIPARSPEGPAS